MRIRCLLGLHKWSAWHVIERHGLWLKKESRVCLLCQRKEIVHYPIPAQEGNDNE